MHEDVHADLGAYALGALSESDRRRFDAHLHSCPSCAGQLEQLAAIPGLVGADAGRSGDELANPGPARGGRLAASEVDAPGQAPYLDEARMRALLDQLRADNRRSARRRSGLAVTAAVLLIAGTAATTRLLGGGSPQSGAAFATLASAQSAATGVSATVGVGQRPWGSLVVLHLRDRQGPRHCRLVVVSRAGRTQTLSSWMVSTPNWTGQAVVYATTDLPLAQISKFKVFSTTTGALLLTISP